MFVVSTDFYFSKIMHVQKYGEIVHTMSYTHFKQYQCRLTSKHSSINFQSFMCNHNEFELVSSWCWNWCADLAYLAKTDMALTKNQNTHIRVQPMFCPTTGFIKEALETRKVKNTMYLIIKEKQNISSVSL